MPNLLTEFLNVWAPGGKASLNLSTSSGLGTVSFSCTLGSPGTPHSSPTSLPFPLLPILLQLLLPASLPVEGQPKKKEIASAVMAILLKG